MTRYTAKPLPADLEPRLRGYLSDELRRIGDAAAVSSNVTLTTRAAAPERIADGQLVYADGTNWDPGNGEGFYARIGGSWTYLSGGLDPAAAETISGNWTFTGITTIDTTVLDLDPGTGGQFDIRWKQNGTLEALLRWDSSTNVLSFQDRNPSALVKATLDLENSRFNVNKGGWLRAYDSGDTQYAQLDYRYLFLDNKEVIAGDDAYLRLNQNGDFTSGVYTAGDFRADGTTKLGNQTVSFTSSTMSVAPTTTNFTGLTVNLSPSGNLNINPGGQMQLLGGNALRCYDQGTTNFIDFGKSDQSGFTPAHYGYIADSEGGAITFQAVSINDDATATFNGDGYGIAVIHNNYNATAYGMCGLAGVNAPIDYGSGSLLRYGSTNPNVDGCVNVWPSAVGALSIKNRLGSSRSFYVMMIARARG